jgi:RNA polymerase sigma-70 factor (ECF subfamily)
MSSRSLNKETESPGLATQVADTATRDGNLVILIRCMAGGDQQAMSALYDATNRLVYGLVLRILSDPGTAEEVLLDVYMQVWRQAAAYDEKRGGPLAWLTTVARSRAIDRLRSGKQRQQREEPLEFADNHSSSTDVEADAYASEMRVRVRAALDGLSPEQREVIELAYYSGMSHSEIALKLNQPLGTVKTRTRLGMIKLRETLKGVQYERGI